MSHQVSEQKSEKIKEIVDAHTPEEFEEFSTIFDKVDSAKGADRIKLLRQLVEQLQHIKDEAVLTYCASALGVVRTRPILEAEPWSGAPDYVCELLSCDV